MDTYRVYFTDGTDELVKIEDDTCLTSQLEDLAAERNSELKGFKNLGGWTDDTEYRTNRRSSNIRAAEDGEEYGSFIRYDCDIRPVWDAIESIRQMIKGDPSYTTLNEVDKILAFMSRTVSQMAD